MDTIKKTHNFTKEFIFSYVISFFSLLCFIVTSIQYWLYVLLVFFILLGIFSYFNLKSQKKSMKYLILQADAIVEEKSLPIIDGEGEISLLSHKLFMLSHRFLTFIETLKNEQIQLKDYIENISHQLKTPITSIRLNQELLLETVQDKSQRNKLVQISKQIEKMSQLVEQLLTLALIDSHSIQFDFQDYPIESIFDRVEENLEYLFLETHTSLGFEHYQGIIFCDLKWFCEAIENIVKNCVEKNHNNQINIEILQDESLTRFIIRDHGKGISKEDLPHLFERFYRGENSSSDGVGIGLALSKQIIEEHHGLIRAYNDHGAVFEITIPRILAKKKI